MFYTCVFTVIALIYSINLYKSHYPNEFDIIVTQIISFIQQNETIKPYLPLLTTMCYNSIYAYSFCQITLNKTIKFIEPYLQEGIKNIHLRILCNTNTDTAKLFTIVNANIYTSCDSNLVVIKSPMPKNDMIILDKVPGNLENITYEPSMSHILSLYLKMVTNDNDTNDNETNDNEQTNDNETNDNKETNYNIQLSSDTMNFYVVGNVFNTNFFKYYLENVLNVKIDNDTNKPFTYKLELMDQNVSMVYLNDTQSIVIKKYGYEILGTNSVTDEVKDNKVKDEKIAADEVPKLDASTICY